VKRTRKAGKGRERKEEKGWNRRNGERSKEKSGKERKGKKMEEKERCACSPHLL